MLTCKEITILFTILYYENVNKNDFMGLITRISSESDAIIREITSQTGKTRIEIIQEALEAYRLKRRMELFNASYAALRANRENWVEELKEREILEGTLEDGVVVASFALTEQLGAISKMRLVKKVGVVKSKKN